jgi:hypothetical protein
MTQQRLNGSGTGQPAATTSLVLGPARREELTKVVGSYPAQWVIIGPCPGGQWFAVPRHITMPFQPGAATRAGLARLQREHAPQTAERPKQRQRGPHHPSAIRPDAAGRVTDTDWTG